MIKIAAIILCLTGLLRIEPRKIKTDNQSFSFEKIIFHTTACNGLCPIYHLEVTQNKQIRLHTEDAYLRSEKFSFTRDSSKIGYFTGTIQDSTYKNLFTELSVIDLNNLAFNNAQCCDGSVITMIVYYNGKRKILRSMFPPEKALKLIGMLYDICGKSQLMRSTKQFTIESDIVQQ